MTTPITMPALSPTMEEGNLAKWHVKVGDKVKPGDIIAEIETDKATMEVEAVDEGTVTKLLVEEGAQGVKVNAVIAELDGGGEAAAPAKAAAAAPKPVAAQPALGALNQRIGAARPALGALNQRGGWFRHAPLARCAASLGALRNPRVGSERCAGECSAVVA